MECHYQMAQEKQNTPLLNTPIKQKAPLRYNRDNIIL